MTYDIEMEPFIELNDGRRFTLGKEKDFDFSIETLAHSLAQMNRWTGHASRPMSVAEHSVLVSKLLPREYALQGLLHDGSEALLADIARPFKPEIKGYKDVETPIQDAIYKAFDIKRTKSSDAVVKRADNTSLLIEAYQLMPSRGLDWPYYNEILESALPGTEYMLEAIEVGKWDWQQARTEFIKQYYLLKEAAFSDTYAGDTYRVW